jgi:hypothetical protein
MVQDVFQSVEYAVFGAGILYSTHRYEDCSPSLMKNSIKEQILLFDNESEGSNRVMTLCTPVQIRKLIYEPTGGRGVIR